MPSPSPSSRYWQFGGCAGLTNARNSGEPTASNPSSPTDIGLREWRSAIRSRGATVIPQRNGASTYLLGDKGRTEWRENNAFLKLEQRLANGDRWRFGWQQQAYSYGQENPQTYLRNAAGRPTACAVIFVSRVNHERDFVGRIGTPPMRLSSRTSDVTGALDVTT